MTDDACAKAAMAVVLEASRDPLSLVCPVEGVTVLAIHWGACLACGAGIVWGNFWGSSIPTRERYHDCELGADGQAIQRGIVVHQGWRRPPPGAWAAALCAIGKAESPDG